MLTDIVILVVENHFGMLNIIRHIVLYHNCCTLIYLLTYSGCSVV